MINNHKDLYEILTNLIKCKSITPQHDGAIDYIEAFLQKLNFKCERFIFEDTTNLYAALKRGGKNLCFCGHVDVVPPGEGWTYNPFILKIKNNKIYGRGVADMKGAIAAFLCAIKNNLNKDFNPANSLSLLITSDEEGTGINGTKKTLEEKIKYMLPMDYCILGEPTAKKISGDTIKIGRRGSVNFNLMVTGKQGHVAYPELAENPITILINILVNLKNFKLDCGTKDFSSSNLEITSIHCDNKTTNIIPHEASAQFNVRFNEIYSGKDIVEIINQQCEKIATGRYRLIYNISGESFRSKETYFVRKVSELLKNKLGIESILNTDGGTSDARFLHKYCDNIFELGLCNKTIHQVDENIEKEDLENLEKIYSLILTDFLR